MASTTFPSASPTNRNKILIVSSLKKKTNISKLFITWFNSSMFSITIVKSLGIRSEIPTRTKTKIQSKNSILSSLMKVDRLQHPLSMKILQDLRILQPKKKLNLFKNNCWIFVLRRACKQNLWNQTGRRAVPNGQSTFQNMTGLKKITFWCWSIINKST